MKKYKCNTTKRAGVAILKVIQTGTPIVYLTDFLFSNISSCNIIKKTLFVFIFISQRFGNKVQEKGYQKYIISPRIC
jgi:hypothetical protein